MLSLRVGFVSFVRAFCFLLALRAHEKLKKRDESMKGSKITENSPKWVGSYPLVLRVFPCHCVAEK